MMLSMILLKFRFILIECEQQIRYMLARLICGLYDEIWFGYGDVRGCDRSELGCDLNPAIGSKPAC